MRLARSGARWALEFSGSSPRPSNFQPCLRLRRFRHTPRRHAFGYHLATVVDDAEQGINCVVRGIDLLSSTPQQIYLQRLLGLETPSYGHIPLLVNVKGKRLAKRDKDAALDALLAAHQTPEALVGHIAYIGGLQEEDQPASPQQLLQAFNLEKFAAKAKARYAITWQ